MKPQMPPKRLDTELKLYSHNSCVFENSGLFPVFYIIIVVIDPVSKNLNSPAG